MLEQTTFRLLSGSTTYGDPQAGNVIFNTVWHIRMRGFGKNTVKPFFSRRTRQRDVTSGQVTRKFKN